MNPIENITVSQDPPTKEEGTLLKVSWIAAPEIFITGIIESQPINFRAEKDYQPQDKVSDLVWFLNVPSCEKYNVSLKIKPPNQNSTVYWSDVVKTVPDFSNNFNLKDLNISIKAMEKRGEILAKWSHTHGCVDKYALELRDVDGDIKGESIQMAPNLNSIVEIDLHMIPGNTFFAYSLFCRQFFRRLNIVNFYNSLTYLES